MNKPAPRPPPIPRVDRDADTQPSMPAVKAAAEAPPAWFSEYSRKQDANHDLLMHEIVGVKEEQRAARRDIIELQAFRAETKEKRSYSGQIKRVSDNDMKQDAALAHVITEVASVKTDVADVKRQININTAETIAAGRATLAVKGALVDGLGGFFRRNPKLETALVGLIMLALSWAYAWLQGKGHGP